MKKLFVLMISVFLLTYSGWGQTMVSIRPGLNFNGFQIGKRGEKIIFYGGMQHAGFFNKYEGSNFTDVTKTSVLMPFVGVKYLVYQQESLIGYVNGMIMKPVFYGKSETDGQANPNFKDDLKALKIWGFELGYGMEYFLAKQFSLGGEFGLRLATYKRESTDPNFSYVDNFRFNMLYSSVSFNFYLVKE